ncbi:hypothetical protein OIU74_026180 [Salix koriyanagi]|uniref:Uncharacterized protein n=1 Tax=Salix koriyanagi TaxID=2511006 RepID=A0A9Q0VY53_9ROSI|nr:hypothetical protein OIU74_026180 [Salix koriyanagi]
MALHVRHVSRASSLQAQAAATAAGTPATMWGALGLPHLTTSLANECHALASEKQPQRARQPRRRWPETGLRRPETGLHWPENGSSITSTHRATCPSTPDNFSGVPAAVARVGSSPAGNRVFDTGATYRAIHSPHFLFRCTAAPHPWQAHVHLPPGPTQDQVGGTPLKSNKCPWSSSRGRHY